MSIDFDWQNEPNAPPRGTRLCGLDELGAGPVEVVLGDSEPFRVVLFSCISGVRAFVNRCPHQWLPMTREPGVFLRYSENEIMCTHHSAIFDLAANGVCTMGPCQGSNLIAVPVTVSDGIVSIAE